MRFDRFTDGAKEIITRAQELLTRLNHQQLDVEHIFYALLEREDGVVYEIFKSLNLPVYQIKDRLLRELKKTPSVEGSSTLQIYITPRLQNLLKSTEEIAKKLGDEYISQEHLLLGMIEMQDGESGRILRDYGITREKVYKALQSIRGTQRVTDPEAEKKYNALQRYTIDITKMAKEGKLDPVIGRDNEIERVMQVLLRKTKNNPVLIGDAGVGKTAVVYGIAQRIVSNNVPDPLKGKKILALDMGNLLAGTKFRGEFEDRLKAVIQEIKSKKDQIILFIDELHNLIGAGAAEGAIDAANLLKPNLTTGEIKVIGATTLDEHREHIEKDGAFERRFQSVYVDEPTLRDTIKILKGLKERYEKHHKVKITEKALSSSAKLAQRYITGRKLPDKAIDLLDEACSLTRLNLSQMPEELKSLKREIEKLSEEGEIAVQYNNTEKAKEIKEKLEKIEKRYSEEKKKWEKKSKMDDVVDEEDIALVVSKNTGIPVARLLEAEAEKLLRMEDELKKWIVGQDEAIYVVAEAIRRNRAGLSPDERPIGAFLFLGPTGVGKTHLARQIARFLFDDENAILRIDLSEYMEKHSVSRLIGAPPGYIGYEKGGQLTETVRRRPYQVILLDEIEKAHPEVFNLLLQVFDAGRLTDSQGHIVDFKNTIIIMTSNIASHKFLQEDDYDIQKAEILQELRKYMRPEFINRIDEIVVFRPLKQEDIEEITSLLLEPVKNSLKEKEIELMVDSGVIEFIAKRGYDPDFGARPLRRTIRKLLENKIAKLLIEGKLKKGDKIRVYKEGEELKFQIANKPQN